MFISRLLVRPGDRVAAGDLVAIVESSKCAVEVCAPHGGAISAVVAQEGDEIRVGGPLAVIRSEEPPRRLPRTLGTDCPDRGSRKARSTEAVDREDTQQRTPAHNRHRCGPRRDRRTRREASRAAAIPPEPYGG